MSTKTSEFKSDFDWEKKAHFNPLFAIMSDNIFKNSNTELSFEELKLFYSQGERFWNRWFHPLLWNLENWSNLRILDYGCGMGRILDQAAKLGLKCDGVDISQTQIEYAQKYCPNKDLINFFLLDKNASIPQRNETYDIVISYAVLQHIKMSSSLKKAICEMSRVLKAYGSIKVQIRSQDKFLSRNKYHCYRTINFENISLNLYFRKAGLFLFPVVRSHKHNHWGGAGCYFSINKLIKIFRKNYIQINQIELDAENHLVWLTGKKLNNNI